MLACPSARIGTGDSHLGALQITNKRNLWRKMLNETTYQKKKRCIETKYY